MLARYDLKFEIANHDFYAWLVQAKARGATEVVFGMENLKTTKYPHNIVVQRFNSIIEPGPAFAGLTGYIGRGGDPTIASSHTAELVKYVKRGGTFERLQSVKPVGSAEYTVTLRQDWRIRSANSNVDAWRKFADDIGATVIEDYDKSQMHIYDKVALYAGAKMNFGVVNGPLFMLTLTDYPVMMFGAHWHRANFNKHGVHDQYPWARDDQRLIYEQDDYDTIRRVFDHWESSYGH